MPDIASEEDGPYEWLCTRPRRTIVRIKGAREEGCGSPEEVFWPQTIDCKKDNVHGSPNHIPCAWTSLSSVFSRPVLVFTQTVPKKPGINQSSANGITSGTRCKTWHIRHSRNGMTSCKSSSSSADVSPVSTPTYELLGNLDKSACCLESC